VLLSLVEAVAFVAAAAQGQYMCNSPPPIGFLIMQVVTVKEPAILCTKCHCHL
jgi:hypothetical protein